MNNIYLKQMQKLGLNTQQYAKLIDIPYGVVKDFINNKEGDYKMGLKDLLRKNMMAKHQDIENNYDNAKIKALEIKQEDINYAEWYDKEYHFDVLKETLQDVNTLLDFENKYCIMVRGIRASHWFYSCLTSKMNYKKRQISKPVIVEFAQQLYDIIVNKNIEKYRETNFDKEKKFDDLFYIKWFEKYDFEEFLKNNNLTKHNLARMMGLGYSTVCLMCSKKYRAIGRVKQLYNIVANVKTEKIREDIRKAQINGETQKIEDLKKEHSEMLKGDNNMIVYDDDKKLKATVTLQNNKPLLKEEKENNNDMVLRKLLVNRLTDEEKELIKIFGGNLEI